VIHSGIIPAEQHLEYSTCQLAHAKGLKKSELQDTDEVMINELF
jgi:hypothetical protein